MNFKIGDIVVAIDDEDLYGCTNIWNKWIGQITEIYDGEFAAKTIFTTDSSIGDLEEFDNLDFDYFITFNQAVKDGVEVEI